MKHGLMFLLILGIVRESPAQESQKLALPNLKRALWGGMNLQEIRAALPEAERMDWEILENGVMLCHSDVGYDLRMLLYDGQLLDISVDGPKPRGKFVTWFKEETARQSADTTFARPRFRAYRLMNEGRTRYEILFPTNLTVLADSMMVRSDSLWAALDSTSVSTAKVQRGRVHVDETPPQPVNSPAPEYPVTAKKARLAGRVLVQCYVDKNGDIRRWKFLKVEPIGAEFAREVARTIPKWKFQPATRQGKPVDTWVLVPFNFNKP